MCRLPLALLIVLVSSGQGMLGEVLTMKEDVWREYASNLLGESVHAPVSVRKTVVAGRSSHPWRRNIMTTVFWIGEKATPNNPVPNDKSSWDVDWAKNYGGYDNPDPRKRRGYLPAAFTPRQNPFYIALPYNDVSRGRTKPEARVVIPWFKADFVRVGKSVCKGRWVAIHYRGRIAFAQWEDVGPFRTDHWEYVFGDDRPSTNRNAGAGLDISPAVRDFLGMKTNDYVDWRFVEDEEVGRGPWSFYENNGKARKRVRTLLADGASVREAGVN